MLLHAQRGLDAIACMVMDDVGGHECITPSVTRAKGGVTDEAGPAADVTERKSFEGRARRPL